MTDDFLLVAVCGVLPQYFVGDVVTEQGDNLGLPGTLDCGGNVKTCNMLKYCFIKATPLNHHHCVCVVIFTFTFRFRGALCIDTA